MNKSRKVIIIQSNRLIEAHYQLTVAEQRLIFAMISMIETKDEDFKSYKIRLTELAELWDITQDVVYREAKKITARLMQRLLKITEPDGTLIQLHWICLSVHKPGYIMLQFHPLLKPYLLQLKGAFTKCNLHMLNQFQSIYTIRIYQLLKQYEKIGSRTFLIDDLKEMLGIEKDKYKVFKDFRRRVLDQARNELDLRADITFDLEGIVKGKKTSEITFKILDKNKLLPVENIRKPTKNNLGKAVKNAVQPAAKPAPEQPPAKVPPPKYWKEFREYAVKNNDVCLIQLIDLDEWDIPALRYDYQEWLRKNYS